MQTANQKTGIPWGVPLLATHHFELLNPAAVHRLTYIDVAFGIHRHGVRVHEFADLVARTPEAVEYLSARAIHDVVLLVYFIDDVHELLARIVGKFNRRARSHEHCISLRARGGGGNGSPHLIAERHVFLEISHRVEKLKPVHPAVADVHDSVVAHANTVWSWPGRGGCFVRRPVEFPLAEIVSAAIEYYDAKIIAA